jgi:transposase
LSADWSHRTEGRKVSVGEAVQAMVLNALGFVGSDLYLTPEFFDNKPVDLLIREGLMADDFNDDRLGRALDMLSQGSPRCFSAWLLLIMWRLWLALNITPRCY